MADMFHAVVDYAARGWRVLPLHTLLAGRCTCGARPQRCKAGKHPIGKLAPHGLKNATADPAKLHDWWTKWPDANVGIATGMASGLIVLDVDPAHGGEDNLHELELANGQLPHTVEAITGSGGRHIYFQHPGIIVSSSAGRVATGIDVRGDDGYVVAPPSLHHSGRRYEWEISSDPANTRLAPIPRWLLTLMADASSRNGQVASDATATPSGLPVSRAAMEFSLHGTPIGQQRERAVAAARSYLGAGYTVQDAARFVWQGLARSPCGDSTHPWTEQDAIDIAADLASKPAPPPGPLNKPRGSPPDPADTAEHRTDLGNARRLVTLHGQDLRYCHPSRDWYVWDERRWAVDQTGAVARRAKATVARIGIEAAAIVDSDERKAMLRHAISSESTRAISAMMTLAQSEPGIPVVPDQLDDDPWLLCCLNGIIDLRTGTLKPHDRAHHITRLAPVEYHPDVRFSLWDRFLAETTGGDAELAAFLQRAAGYSLTGSTKEEVLLFAHGPSAAGKSTFLEAIKTMMGEYATTADFETFLARRDGGGPRPDVARLAGARLVASIEVDQGKRLAEGLIKLLTGGDTVTARHLYQTAFEFRPTFKLWLAANHAPAINDEDEAMWRRMLRVPFEHVVPRERRDPAVKQTLRESPEARAAILAWAVEGCLAWQRRGLDVPAIIAASTLRMRLDMDPLGEFIRQCCVLEPAAAITAADLRKAYDAWGKEQGDLRPVRGRAWGEKLTAWGCTRGVSGRGSESIRYWRGIRLLEQDENPSPPTDSYRFEALSIKYPLQNPHIGLSGKCLQNEESVGSCIFNVTADWQDLPENAVMPPGCEYRLNMTTGRRQARLDPRLATPDEFAEPEPDWTEEGDNSDVHL